MQPNTIADPGAAPGDPAETFGRLVRAILDRFLWQNGLTPVPYPTLDQVGRRLWALVEERGLPRSLGPAEVGAPGEIPEADAAALVARALGDLPPATRDALATPVRQLVKACFNPEFKVCRDSYKEVSPDGTCRRQELDRTRKRASGAHCVDCPYWVGLTPGQHMLFLAKAWRPAGLTCFISHVDVFLPEDFRGLRQLLHAQARVGR